MNPIKRMNFIILLKIQLIIKKIIHLIIGNNNNINSKCIELNKKTLKYIKDSIAEVNVNNEKSKNMIEIIKRYVQDEWIININIINEEFNNIGHIFCKEHMDKRISN